MSSKAYFAEVAGDWDEIRSSFFTEQMRDAAIALADLSPEMVVADVGTGTGFVIQGLAGKVAKVYGFDESPEMLVVAERNLAAFDNVEFQVAPGSALPLPDDSLDAIFGNMYLHHAPNPSEAVKELVRVLKPNGRLILTDLDAHDQEWMREEMADRWLGFEREDIRAWYSATGLTDVTVEFADGRCSSTTPDGGDIELSIFVAFGRKG
jgi:ubiquinone/menaquinone biosynthesis C-methylase UbiE